MDEIKEPPEGENTLSPQEAREKRQKQFNSVLLAIFFLVIGFALWAGYEASEPSRSFDEAKKSLAEKKQSSNYSYSDTSASSYADESYKPNPNEWKPGITVVATPVQLGDDLVIRTRVNNRNIYDINEKVYLYVVDGTGSKHFVDVLYADLNGGQAGNATSSI
jgi:cytoskeletal protein RodZ